MRTTRALSFGRSAEFNLERHSRLKFLRKLEAASKGSGPVLEPLEPEQIPVGNSTEQSNEKPEGQQDAKPYEWILGPVIDILFSCGGLIWLLFGFHYFFVGAHITNVPAQGLLIMVILATHLLSETHNMATLERIFSEKDKSKFQYFKEKLIAICGTLAIFGIVFPDIASVFTKIYLIWVAQHFTAQTYGLALLYCYKRNYKLSDFGKKIFLLLMQVTAAFAIVRQFTFYDWGGGEFLGLAIPFWGPLPEPIFMVTSFTLAILAGLFLIEITRVSIVERRNFPLPAALITISGILIWILGKEATGTLWLYVPAFYHGSQYLVISLAYHLKSKGLPEGVPAKQIASQLMTRGSLKYCALLIAAATFVYIGIPHVLQQMGCVYDVVFASVFCAINFHHFLTDAAIWKLRDKSTREILIA